MPTFDSVISPTSPEIVLWAEGHWMTPLLEIDVLNNSTTWSRLRWKEQNTKDETVAYVRVDFLDSSDNVLLADVQGSANGDFKEIDMSVRDSINTSDLYIKFKIYSKANLSPIISNIVIS